MKIVDIIYFEGWFLGVHDLEPCQYVLWIHIVVKISQVRFCQVPVSCSPMGSMISNQFQRFTWVVTKIGWGFSILSIDWPCGFGVLNLEEQQALRMRAALMDQTWPLKDGTALVATFIGPRHLNMYSFAKCHACSILCMLHGCHYCPDCRDCNWQQKGSEMSCRNVTEKIARSCPKKYKSKNARYTCMRDMRFVEALTQRQLVCQFPILHVPRYIVLQPGRAG